MNEQEDRPSAFQQWREEEDAIVSRYQRLLPLLQRWREEEDEEEEDELLADLLSSGRRPLLDQQEQQEEEESHHMTTTPSLIATFVQYLRTLISPPPPPPRSRCEEEQHETQIRVLTAHAESVEREKQTLSHDRNITLSLVAQLSQHLGLVVGLSRNIDAPEGSQISLFLELPSGQVSWTIPDEDLSFFDDVIPYEGNYDGHTQTQKWERVLHPQLALSVLSPHQLPTLPVDVPTGDDLRTDAKTIKRRAVKKKHE